jgi:hypothetical protein
MAGDRLRNRSEKLFKAFYFRLIDYFKPLYGWWRKSILKRFMSSIRGQYRCFLMSGYHTIAAFWG